MTGLVGGPLLVGGLSPTPLNPALLLMQFWLSAAYTKHKRGKLAILRWNGGGVLLSSTYDLQPLAHGYFTPPYTSQFWNYTHGCGPSERYAKSSAFRKANSHLPAEASRSRLLEL